MKIALDARWIFDRISGIGSYTRELLRQFALLGAENEYVLFFDDAARARMVSEELELSKHSGFKVRCLPYGIFSLRNQFSLPRLLQCEKPDVFHSPNYMIPLLAFSRRRRHAVKCVITIHDIIPLRFPDFAPRARKRRWFFVYRRLMREIACRADAIITVSETSRRDIADYLLRGLARPPLVAVIPEGVAPFFRPVEQSMAPLPETPRRIFWVGRHDPYKNLCGLIRAFAELRRRVPFPIQLRLGGAPDPRYPEALQLVQQLGLAGQVVWLGYLSDAQLLAEYQQAHLFVMPSFYEGFGLPVLEAMACGTPVVCAKRASLPEIAGDAAVLVEPDDVPAMAAAMQKVLSDTGLAQELAKRGMARARLFTWEHTARATLEFYRQVTAS